MHLLDLTLNDPAENLALDEALLEQAESQSEVVEVLRLWEPKQPMVVLGRSSPLDREVNLEYCQQYQIPILRRCSGGATIVTGPGCLMYAVLLNYRNRAHLRMLDQAHQYVLNQLQAAIQSLDLEVRILGTSDLTFGNRKFSGNSLRCRKNNFLYHGTIICDFDLSLVSNCLGTPQRQPAYRAGREHLEFLTRLPLPVVDLRNAFIRQWHAGETFFPWPQELTERLAAEKYRTANWTNSVR